MIERPILFSGAMVRAILEGAKTQTRRVVRGVDECPHGYDVVKHVDGGKITLAGGAKVNCPYGQPGERLWVRETWGPCDGGYCYRASERAGVVPDGGRWVPSIHMPRDACRMRLEVTGVRVERLQAITEHDVRAEGCEVRAFWTFGADREERQRIAAGVYRTLWDSLNAKRGLGWAVNPWVWVVEFKRCPATP